MKWFKNWRGDLKGYGRCQCCGDSWSWKKSCSIKYEKNSSMFPICQECFDRIDETVILQYCKRLIAKWLSTGRLEIIDKHKIWIKNIKKSIKEQKVRK